MADFNEREKGFEAKFKLDEELQIPKFDADVFRPLRAELTRIAHDFEVETARQE